MPGDFSTLEVLRELEAIGPPVVGVHGNVDSAELRRLLPEERVVEAGGARIAMVHDAGPRAGRSQRMRPASASAPTRSCSATPTCRCTSGPTTASRSSTRAARRSAAGRPRTRWG